MALTWARVVLGPTPRRNISDSGIVWAKQVAENRMESMVSNNKTIRFKIRNTSPTCKW